MKKKPKKKPITTRERKLMKLAFEAGREFRDRDIFQHGNFKHFLASYGFVPGYMTISPMGGIMYRITGQYARKPGNSPALKPGNSPEL